MKVTQVASADQVIPISEARERLSELVDTAGERSFWLISRKYKPQAALVGLNFMNELLSVHEKWQRKQNVAELRRIRRNIPKYPPEEVEKDIEDAIKAVRRVA